MHQLRERHLVGLDYLHGVTALLQRIRTAHPTAGLFDAAEVQWWWVDAAPSTDDLPQLFWFDDVGRPAAAVIATDFGRRMQLDPIVMPEATPEWVAHVVERGLAHAAEYGIDPIGLEVDRADDHLREVLGGHGFTVGEGGLVETWLAAGARPPISPLAAGYRLSSRSDTIDRPHHMSGPKRRNPDVAGRLRQTSLYRPDLDLVVFDDHDRVTAYGLFWYDPVTATGVVEPMRTADEHQRRGLARHVLTTGIDLLARAGATRIKICYEPDNPASSDLYLTVGFQPHRHTDVFVRGAARAVGTDAPSSASG